MSHSRQLAAIMFTDIQGYTALMQQNEAKAIQFRDKHRRIFNSTTEKYKGRILQYYGDGTLSIFDSAIDAVNCAIEMQLGFREHPAIPVRIGIHTGDILFSHEDIIGDGVNVASRIESLSVPGSVFISDKVYDEIKNQETIKTSMLKAFKLKNVEKPMQVYAISNEGLIVPENTDLDQAESTISTPILATKLYIPPPRPKAVPRPRLIERLNEGTQRKLTLVIAPAGFGKTTLVSEWVAACERPAAWLSLDEGDNDLTRFLAHFIAALQTIVSHIGESALGVLHSPQPQATESTLTTLLNEINAVRDEIIFVLDDYHIIDAESVQSALTFVLEHLPPQMHLIITTREEPNLPLPRLRVRGQLTEVRVPDLRFTSLEAAEFLNRGMDLNLSTEHIDALENRTEGWVAGLQLAAISMQGCKDVGSFINSFTGSHAFVMDYLLEEVLHQQSESVQTFLLHTSILDRICAPLCDAVLGDISISGRETLEYLEQANLFIIPLDNERCWYRYHHLFADLLRQRLQQSADSPAGEKRMDVTELHHRASLWYEHNDFEAEAIHHALISKDFDRAAALVELIWPAMDAGFQPAAWLTWAKMLPDEVVQVRPVLCVDYAWALLDVGELEASESLLRAAEQWLSTTSGQGDSPMNSSKDDMIVADQEQFRSLPASIEVARTYHAQVLGRLSDTVKHAQHALELLPEKDYLKHGQVASLLGLAYWATGDLDAGFRSVTDGMISLKKAGNILFALSSPIGLGDIRVAQGRLREAKSIYEDALQLAKELDNAVPPVTADLHLGLALIYHEQNNQPAATKHFQMSKEMGEQATLADWPYRWYRAQARIKESLGDLSGALDMLKEAERVFFRSPLPDVRPVAALKTQIRIKQGRLPDAQAWIDERGLSARGDLSYLQEFEYITLVRLRIAEYRHGRANSSILEALELLGRLLTAADDGQRMGSQIEILILQALAHEARETIPEALVPLERAMDLAEPEGYVRIFIDEGAPMARLLAEAAAHGIQPDYTAALLATFETEA